MRRLVLALKPGGWLFVSEECEGYVPLETEKGILKRDQRILRDRLRQVMSGVLGLTSFRFFVSGTIAPLLENQGAVVMHTETYDWEGLPYLQRTWARRIAEPKSTRPAHPDYQVLPEGLRNLRDCCLPFIGRQLSPEERRRVKKLAKLDDRLAPLAMFLLMAEHVDPGLSSEQPSLMTKLRSHIPASRHRAHLDWLRLSELFAEFRALVSG
jgi:hypothetical protein